VENNNHEKDASVLVTELNRHSGQVGSLPPPDAADGYSLVFGLDTADAQARWCPESPGGSPPSDGGRSLAGSPQELEICVIDSDKEVIVIDEEEEDVGSSPPSSADEFSYRHGCEPDHRGRSPDLESSQSNYRGRGSEHRGSGDLDLQSKNDADQNGFEYYRTGSDSDPREDDSERIGDDIISDCLEPGRKSSRPPGRRGRWRRPPRQDDTPTRTTVDAASLPDGDVQRLGPLLGGELGDDVGQFSGTAECRVILDRHDIARLLSSQANPPTEASLRGGLECVETAGVVRPMHSTRVPLAVQLLSSCIPTTAAAAHVSQQLSSPSLQDRPQMRYSFRSSSKKCRLDEEYAPQQEKEEMEHNDDDDEEVADDRITSDADEEQCTPVATTFARRYSDAAIDDVLNKTICADDTALSAVQTPVQGGQDHLAAISFDPPELILFAKHPRRGELRREDASVEDLDTTQESLNGTRWSSDMLNSDYDPLPTLLPTGRKRRRIGDDMGYSRPKKRRRKKLVSNVLLVPVDSDDSYSRLVVK